MAPQSLPQRVSYPYGHHGRAMGSPVHTPMKPAPVKRRPPRPHSRIPVQRRTARGSGLVEVIPSLQTAAAAFLSFISLVIFFPVSIAIALAGLVFLVAFGAFFILLTVLPFFWAHTPYQTPFTAIVWHLLATLLRIYLRSRARLSSTSRTGMFSICAHPRFDAPGARSGLTHTPIPLCVADSRRIPFSVEYTVEASRLNTTGSEAFIWIIARSNVPSADLADFFASITTHPCATSASCSPLRRDHTFAQRLLKPNAVMSRLRRIVRS
ncbi:hypothetical protein K488DRAFT_83309 [Vararia minispora EC-137]|uniref:Uncharacterized protein n=1 Tax=Vararia minispora EC-137 TaxID=1314806 RepID=A0ACB8QU05_9AGAM|nr:hypothetical protein K488DRAFT_83309 [Vararia minispora EC-137]